MNIPIMWNLFIIQIFHINFLMKDRSTLSSLAPKCQIIILFSESVYYLQFNVRLRPESPLDER
jgi:hypothetical protein